MKLHESSYLEELKEGNLDRFRKIYEQHHGKVYQYILRFVRSKEIAEEITSDVFVRIWNKFIKTNDAKDVGGIIFRIARDYAIDHLRKAARSSELRKNWIQSYHESISNVIEEALYHKEEMERINKIIQSIPDKRRLVFEMRFRQDMTNEQIAKVLDISPNTVKVHLTRASNYIRKCIFKSSDLAGLLAIATVLNLI